MSAELIQTLIVSAIALGAAGMMLWRLARPYFTASATAAPCARCQGSRTCAPLPAAKPLIQIQRRGR